jgi:magnesium transporter
VNDLSEGESRTRGVFGHRTPPGSTPGSLVSDPEAPFPEIRVMAWSEEDFFEKSGVSLKELEDLLGRWPMTWVNVDGLGDAETLRKLGDLFDVHKLALEDVVHVHQRAKVEEYGDHLFIVGRMLFLEGERIRTEQISLFLSAGVLLTFQEQKGDCLEPVRDRIRKGKGRIRVAGADYLAYAILDAVVDAWFPLLEEYGEMLEDLEDNILDLPGRETVAEIHHIKRDLLEIRRAIWPMRETVNGLFRQEELIQKETHLYLRDCYDHVTQIIDIVESYRDMASGLMDLYLSSVSNRMNEVMKVLTVIATIFIPLTFIAGIYGMNFNTEISPFNMPELNWKYGYLIVWGIMVALGGVMLGIFRRRGWLGGGKKRGGP